MMKGRRREGSDGGEKEGGGVMERRGREGEQWRGGGRDGGGREWCEVRSEEELTHLGSLSLACSWVLAVLVWVFIFIRIRSTHGHSFPFVLVRSCSWAYISTGGQLSPFVCTWLRWWAFVFNVVVQSDPRGGS